MTEQTIPGPVRMSIEIAVYLLIIFGLVAWCLQILAPFISFMLWGIIIAVSIYPVFQKARARLGGRNKLTVILFVLLSLAIIIGPALLFGGSLLDSASSFRHDLQSGEVTIPKANPKVESWPVVGEKLYTNWSQAAGNLEAWMNQHGEQIHAMSEKLIGKVTGIGLAVLQFIAATLIAALMLSFAQSSVGFCSRFSRRLAGDQGDEMLELATATIRSITVGVLGIALIQAILGGIGMVVMDVPAAGVWTLIILVLAIAQLPPWLVLIPVIIFVFGHTDNTVAATIFAIWSIIVSFLDMVLKPLMLGRGVNVPMPVVLIGAIGGLIHSGIIGLFLGAVVLAVGYRLFMAWLDAGQPEEDDNAQAASSGN